jgi:hypothetical protein
VPRGVGLAIVAALDDNRQAKREFCVIGERICAYDVDVTGLTGYCVTLPAMRSGRVRVAPQGARIDVAFADRASGHLTGRVQGIDCLRLRADGGPGVRQAVTGLL